MKRPRMMTLVRVYGLASSLVLSGFMAWFFWTLNEGSIWLVSPDEWNGFEFILSLLTCLTISLMIVDFLKDIFNHRLTKGMQVSKVIETKVYGNIFTVALPIRFFFNKDNSYDGLEVHVENASKRDQDLVKELCEKLSEASQIE